MDPNKQYRDQDPIIDEDHSTQKTDSPTNTDMDYDPLIALPLPQEDELQSSTRVLKLETQLSGRKRGGDTDVTSSPAKKARMNVMAVPESATPAAPMVNLQTCQTQITDVPGGTTCNFQPAMAPAEQGVTTESDNVTQQLMGGELAKAHNRID